MPVSDSPRTDTGRRVVLPPADVAIDAITTEELVARVLAESDVGRGGLIVTPNVDHLRQIATGSWLGSVYAEADLVVADGMPLVWASQLLGDPLPERVAGADLLWSLTEGAAAHGRSIYLLGGAPGAADELAARFQDRWPALKVAGTACPEFGFERRRGGVDAIADRVEEAAPDIVFTALGAPKQDYLNLHLHRRLPSAWYLGVGAAVDMGAGRVRRAPGWAQQTGTEWLFRLAQEPRRMARRYLVEDTPFALRMLAASAARGRRARR